MKASLEGKEATMGVWHDIWPELTILIYVLVLGGAMLITFLLTQL